MSAAWEDSSRRKCDVQCASSMEHLQLTATLKPVLLLLKLCTAALLSSLMHINFRRDTKILGGLLFRYYLPGHLESALHARDALFKMSKETMDVSQLSVSSSRGRGVIKVMGYHQPFLKANLSTRTLNNILTENANSWSTEQAGEGSFAKGLVEVNLKY